MTPLSADAGRLLAGMVRGAAKTGGQWQGNWDRMCSLVGGKKVARAARAELIAARLLRMDPKTHPPTYFLRIEIVPWGEEWYTGTECDRDAALAAKYPV